MLNVNFTYRISLNKCCTLLNDNFSLKSRWRVFTAGCFMIESNNYGTEINAFDLSFLRSGFVKVPFRKNLRQKLFKISWEFFNFAVVEACSQLVFESLIILLICHYAWWNVTFLLTFRTFLLIIQNIEKCTVSNKKLIYSIENEDGGWGRVKLMGWCNQRNQN